MTISTEDMATWQNWVGRTETREEVLDPEALRRYAAALGEDLDVERVMPSLAHWAFFLPVAAADEIGADGHPKRGGFLPPVTLPRRMFAGSEMSFDVPLAVRVVARRTSTIASVTHKPGRSGDLVLVEVENRIEQHGRLCVKESQTIVYRGDGGATPAVVSDSKPAPCAPDDMSWEPGPVDLFRFSAVTFNSHRIHYDLPYATDVEGYPGLVVHGPFTAVRLHHHAARGGMLSQFAFRAMSPLFAGQPIRIARDPANAGVVEAIRCDGVVAMRATATVAA